MPAAAVIPAPVAYIKVAAVKKLVVGVRSPNRNIIGFVVTMSYEHARRLVDPGRNGSPLGHKRLETDASALTQLPDVDLSLGLALFHCSLSLVGYFSSVSVGC